LLRKSSDETQSSTSQSPDGKNPRNSTALDGIKDLELDEMLMPWNNICCVAKRFGSLKTLTASSNSLRMLYVPLSTPHLTSLTLEYNLFESLLDLSELSSISTLETLRLKGNYISKIAQSPGPKFTFGSKVGYVDLSYNDVADWAFVDTLADVFPGLRALRLSHNPIYEGASTGMGQVTSIEEGYMLTIARLGKLTALNFSNITAADRTNAEMYYLSRIGKAMGEVAEAEEQSVASQHKRYPELCEKYGAPVVVRTKAGAVNPDFLEARLIKFTFYLPPKEGSHEKPITKLREIPKSFDIYRVKGIVGRMFDIRPLSMRLIWETGDWDPVAGYEEEEKDEDSDDEGEGKLRNSETAASAEKGKWMRREVEIEDGTRQVGFCVDGMEAKVRIEFRRVQQ
jgi:tubulin-specific chaperone E